MPALEVEELVAAQVISLLKSPERVLSIFTSPTSPSDDTRRLLHAVRNMRVSVETLFPGILRRVVVHDDRLEIQVGRQTLLKELLGKDVPPFINPLDGDDVCKLTVPTVLKRRGGEVRFLFVLGTAGLNPEPVASLINAVACARDWIDKIIRGDTANTPSIAAETGLDVRYVRKHISLAFLAPDITEAILEGTHVARVSLGDWLGRPPIDWALQRSELSREHSFTRSTVQRLLETGEE